MTRDDIIREFSRIYYDEERKSPILKSTRWMGVPIMKAPTDLWMYQEIMWETRPDIVIETGTWQGGSALWFAHMAEIMGMFGVISIDIHHIVGLPQHEKIKYLTGSSVSQEIVSMVDGYIRGAEGRMGRTPRVMVVLDSDHRASHVLQELDSYSRLVTPGCYLVVEDGNINGHPVLAGWGAGPMEAVRSWAPRHPEFRVDRSREKFLLTMNPEGFLKREGSDG